MKLTQQLVDKARADLASLEKDTEALQANVRRQNADLDSLRREARAGRAEFAEVVTQQSRRDAAAGMLAQHLEDLAQARAMLEELEAADAAQGTTQEAIDALARMQTLEEKYHALADDTERLLAQRLGELAALQKDHNAAQDTLGKAALARLAQVHNVNPVEARELLSHTSRRNPNGPGVPLLMTVRELCAEIAGDEADHAEGLIFQRLNPVPRWAAPDHDTTARPLLASAALRRP